MTYPLTWKAGHASIPKDQKSKVQREKKKKNDQTKFKMLEIYDLRWFDRLTKQIFKSFQFIVIIKFRNHTTTCCRLKWKHPPLSEINCTRRRQIVANYVKNHIHLYNLLTSSLAAPRGLVSYSHTTFRNNSKKK